VSPDELLRIVATPTRLGVHLAPELWGYDAEYRVDPWLAMAEQRVLDAVLDREHQRFVRIHVPPQIGKTSFSGGFLPFWLLGMFPDTRIIFISYSDDYSRLRGGEVRDMVAAYGLELFGIELDPNYQSATDWRIKGHRGGMLSVGIGSQITGRSGDIVIIDDVLKNMQEAASMATKMLHVREYDGTIRPRLQPGGTIIMTSTRWADDDLAGVIGTRTQQPGYRGDPWEVLSFPAIAEPSDEEIQHKVDFDLWEDELGRKYGEPLACRFYPDPTVEWEESIFYNIRRSGTDLFTFSCAFQQNPIASEAGMFPPGKWARYRTAELPDMISTVRVWDPAATAGGGDYSVGVKVGKGKDGRFYILDVWRHQLDSDQVLDAALVIAKSDGFMCDVGVEQEKAGAGKGTVRFWDVELAKHGYRVFPCPTTGSKEERAKPASTLQHGGRLVIPDDEENIEWVNPLIDQSRRIMGDGRRGRHDDIVDGLAHAVLKLLDAASVDFWDPGTAYEGEVSERQMEDWIMKHLMGIG
jgi:predicted phage terminase large subunit-like protein